MAQSVHNTTREEWLRVLGEGMVTLPIRRRDEVGIENGDVGKAKKEGNTVVIEAQAQRRQGAPYRVYSAEEIRAFVEEDRVSEDFATRVQARLSKSSHRSK